MCGIRVSYLMPINFSLEYIIISNNVWDIILPIIEIYVLPILRNNDVAHTNLYTEQTWVR